MIENELQNTFSTTNSLVTGGTGLIGRQIAKRLCDAGAYVRVVSMDHVEVEPRAEHVYGDLTDFSFCREQTKDMDYVFHLAGIKGSVEVTKSRPASFFVPLLMMNTNMLEACRLNKVRKVVYTSSIGAYPSAEVFRENMGSDGPPWTCFRAGPGAWRKCRFRHTSSNTVWITSQWFGLATAMGQVTTSIRPTPWSSRRSCTASTGRRTLWWSGATDRLCGTFFSAETARKV